MDAKALEKKFDVSAEQPDAWAEPFENGEWPEEKTVRIGRPRLADEEVRPVTFKMSVSEIKAIDALVKRTGRSRSQVLRDGVRRELAET